MTRLLGTRPLPVIPTSPLPWPSLTFFSAALLGAQCRLGERASDDEFLQIVGKNIVTRNICKLEQAGIFSINHYAGKVFYTAEGFVMKNTDTLPAEMTELMLGCEGLGLLKEALQVREDG